MSTALVTGGAGFLGSHLCERLLERGHRVICLDNLETSTIENIDHIRDERFHFLPHDVTERIYVDGTWSVSYNGRQLQQRTVDLPNPIPEDLYQRNQRLLALNKVFGPCYDVEAAEADDQKAFEERWPKNQFIFDVQTHHVDVSRKWYDDTPDGKKAV